MEAQFRLNLLSRFDLLLTEAELDKLLENEVTPPAAWFPRLLSRFVPLTDGRPLFIGDVVK